MSNRRQAKQPKPTRRQRGGKSTRAKSGANMALDRGDMKSIPAARTRVARSRNARMYTTRDSCRVRHRELVGSVRDSSGGTEASPFVITNTIIANPGLSSSFPWLAGIARNWESYRFEKLRYDFVTRVGTTTTGSVIITPDYDVKDPPPADESAALANLGAKESAPWVNFGVDLLRDRLNGQTKSKYVREGVTSGDPTLYDAAVVYFCLADTDPGFYGKVYVEYDVIFYNQASPSKSITQGARSYHKAMNSTQVIINNGTGISEPFDEVVDFDVKGAGKEDPGLGIEYVPLTRNFVMCKGSYTLTTNLVNELANAKISTANLTLQVLDKVGDLVESLILNVVDDLNATTADPTKKMVNDIGKVDFNIPEDGYRINLTKKGSFQNQLGQTGAFNLLGGGDLSWVDIIAR